MNQEQRQSVVASPTLRAESYYAHAGRASGAWPRRTAPQFPTAPRRSAQGQLPQLVRRLIAESALTILRLDFPSGEGVQQPGWDGIAEVSGAARFAPRRSLRLSDRQEKRIGLVSCEPHLMT